jgi:hypothetical protein
VARVLQTMFSNCTDPARELEFNRWYTHTHLPDLSCARGFVAARRFENAMPAPGAARYLAIYELEADSPERALAELTRLALQAFDRGRHIDCIAGVPAGNTPMGALWREIEPASVAPLERHDYPGASRELRAAMLAFVDQLEGSRG